ncbi:MAG: methylated-DNA--[protein]-cysteine S-methyltransferase [Alphaproteobacteria bacterium]
MSPLIEQIIYGFYVGDLGEMIIAQSDLGLCWLGFVQEGGDRAGSFAQLKARFPEAALMQSDAVADNLGRRLVRAWQDGRERAVEVDLRGTDFQVEVWNALRDVGRGYVCSYSEVADMVMRPKAVRAVGRAVACNPVSVIVPCHRVVQKSGRIGQYAWGEDLKRSLLIAEGVAETLLQ